MAATALPHHPVPLAGLACWGPVLITQGLHRVPWLPYTCAPHPPCPFVWRGGGKKLPWWPQHGPWGEEVLASAPCAAPRGMGVGCTFYEGKGRLKAWTLCDGLGEGVMG